MIGDLKAKNNMEGGGLRDKNPKILGLGLSTVADKLRCIMHGPIS